MKPRRAKLIHQSLRDGRDAIGRDQKRKDKEHDPAQRLAADEQGHGKQGQHHAGHNENRSCHTEQKRHHGGQNGEHHHKGDGKDFQNDYKRLPPVKVDGLSSYQYYTSAHICKQGCRWLGHFGTFCPKAKDGHNARPVIKVQLFFWRNSWIKL